jgi:UDPglucose 6-dehydrogenase
MRIAVVGSGHVGLLTGVCFADLGHEVVLGDNGEEKLTTLRNGEVPIHERFLPELLRRYRGHRIKFSGDLQAAMRESEAVFIAGGTPPTETGDADLTHVESVTREISGAVEGYKMAVEKSTVPVYTSQLVWLQITTLANQGSFQAQVAKITENPLGYKDQNGEAADDLRTKPA